MSVFVSIICYQDVDVINTVNSMLSNSADRSQLNIVIILQTDNRHLFTALDSMPNVTVHTFPTSWAEGCGKARAEALKHYSGQQYFFQTDSHMRFEPMWDKLLIEELNACPADKPILTTLPPGFVIALEKRDPPAYIYLAVKEYYQGLPLSIGYMSSINDKPAIPQPTPLLAGGYMFSRGSLCSEFSYDPYMYFHGEEVSTSVRLWTLGYQNFCPRICVCYHAYRQTAGKAPAMNEVIAQTKDVELHARSIARARSILGYPIDDKVNRSHLIKLDEYGVGDVRTVQSWFDTHNIVRQ